jgi:hypothetical protein
MISQALDFHARGPIHAGNKLPIDESSSFVRVPRFESNQVSHDGRDDTIPGTRAGIRAPLLLLTEGVRANEYR